MNIGAEIGRLSRTMARKPQSLEPFSKEYLSTLADQLRSTADIISETVASMEEKQVESIYVLYAGRVKSAEDMALKVRDLIYRSHMALRAGKPLNESSVSHRSVRKDAIEKEAKESLKRTRSKGKKE